MMRSSSSSTAIRKWPEVDAERAPALGPRGMQIEDAERDRQAFRRSMTRIRLAFCRSS